MTSVETDQEIDKNEKLDELKRTIEQASTQIEDAEELRKACSDHIGRALAKGEALDPRNSDRSRPLGDFYRSVYLCFHQKGFKDAAARLLIEIWQELQSIQRNENSPIYDLDVIAATLSDTYDHRGDKSAAMRWALALLASEVLDYGGLSQPVRGRILEWYGVPFDAMNKLGLIALKNRSAVADVQNWLIPEAFAEDVVTKFQAQYQEHGVLFARHTPTVNEFPLSRAYYSSLLEKMDSAATTAEKGKTLEDLATYLTLLIPGWIPRRNVKTVYNEFESDIIVSNLIQAGNLNAELFGRNFLIECKNWNAPVGVPEVGYFLYRMRLTHTSFGILFASNGITGGKENPEDKDKVRKAATSMIHRAFNEDGNICIVLTSEDLNQLKDGRSFWAMIVNKARTVQYGKSIYKAF